MNLYRKTLIFSIILTSFFEVKAQNARIDALGNNFIIDDLSAVITNPSSSVNYRDIVQATAYQDGSFGSVIGIKSLGKMLSFGFSANNQSYFEKSFYDDAISFLDSTIDTSFNLPCKLPEYPHLLLSLHLQHINIGFDAFYKRTLLESSYSTTGYDELVKKDILVMGIFCNASIIVNSIGIFPFFGYSIPKAQGYAKYSDTPIIERSSTTKNNSSIEYGVELNLYLDMIDIRIGGNYSLVKYNFLSEQNSDYGNPENNISNFNCYGGLTITPNENLLLSAAYSFTYGMQNQYSHYANTSLMETSQLDQSHFVVGSCEYTIPLDRYLDNFSIRCGITWSLKNSSFQSVYDSSNIRTEVKESYPDSASSLTPTIGLGFSKGIIKFDIASKLAGWDGLTSGMPVLTGTLTLDFSKRKRN